MEFGLNKLQKLGLLVAMAAAARINCCLKELAEPAKTVSTQAAGLTQLLVLYVLLLIGSGLITLGTALPAPILARVLRIFDDFSGHSDLVILVLVSMFVPTILFPCRR